MKSAKLKRSSRHRGSVALAQGRVPMVAALTFLALLSMAIALPKHPAATHAMAVNAEQPTINVVKQ